jgi:hypothetical protein
MKKSAQILICICLLSVDLSAQDFVNGDLDGVITGFSSLPSSWTSIDSSDPNCEADPGGTSPDLTNTTQPGSDVNGMIGTPYSGSTFVAGSYGGTPGGTFFQEGIQQNVGGFTVGESYIVRFHQSVIKTQFCADTSGTWTIVLDNTVIGIPEVTVSQEAYNSISTNWEMREILFTASQNSHDFKFLPSDDDTNQVAIIGDENGCLHMGLDSISIQLPLGVGTIEKDFGSDLSLYPNPTKGDFSIDLGQKHESVKITITDLRGRAIQSHTYYESKVLNLRLDEPAGIYLLVLESNEKIAVLELMKE